MQCRKKEQLNVEPGKSIEETGGENSAEAVRCEEINTEEETDSVS